MKISKTNSGILERIGIFHDHGGHAGLAMQEIIDTAAGEKLERLIPSRIKYLAECRNAWKELNEQEVTSGSRVALSWMEGELTVTGFHPESGSVDLKGNSKQKDGSRPPVRISALRLKNDLYP